jgi:NADH:ubiquinone oxidoreductase subunit B-like Fe-S oxidoreductase
MRSAIQGQNTQKGNPTKSRTVLANSRPKTTTDIKKSRERSPMIAEFLLACCAIGEMQFDSNFEANFMFMFTFKLQ